MLKWLKKLNQVPGFSSTKWNVNKKFGGYEDVLGKRFSSTKWNVNQIR